MCIVASTLRCCAIIRGTLWWRTGAGRVRRCGRNRIALFRSLSPAFFFLNSVMSHSKALDGTWSAACKSRWNWRMEGFVTQSDRRIVAWRIGTAILLPTSLPPFALLLVVDGTSCCLYLDAQHLVIIDVILVLGVGLDVGAIYRCGMFSSWCSAFKTTCTWLTTASCR